MRNSSSFVFLAILFFSGCYGFWDQPQPSQEEYLKRFLPALAHDPNLKINYFFKGSVGGCATIAYIQCRERQLQTVLEKAGVPSDTNEFSVENSQKMLEFRVREIKKELGTDDLEKIKRVRSMRRDSRGWEYYMTDQKGELIFVAIVT